MRGGLAAVVLLPGYVCSIVSARARPAGAAMRGTRRPTLSLAGMVVFVHVCPALSTATRTTNIEDRGEEAEGRRNPCTTTALAVAETAQRLCGGVPIEEALLAVRLQPGVETDAAGRALAGLGLRTALDLQLMQAGGPEVAELTDVLTLAGVSLGNRVKIRLLVGDQAHQLGRLTSADAAQDLTGRRPAIPQPQQGEGSAADDSVAGGPGAAARKQRRLQTDPAVDKVAAADGGGGGGGGGMSMDTIAIVLTVLIGAAGSKSPRSPFCAPSALRAVAAQVHSGSRVLFQLCHAGV